MHKVSLCIAIAGFCTLAGATGMEWGTPLFLQDNGVYNPARRAALENNTGHIGLGKGSVLSTSETGWAQGTYEEVDESNKTQLQFSAAPGKWAFTASMQGDEKIQKSTGQVENYYDKSITDLLVGIGYLAGSDWALGLSLGMHEVNVSVEDSDYLGHAVRPQRFLTPCALYYWTRTATLEWNAKLTAYNPQTLDGLDELASVEVKDSTMLGPVIFEGGVTHSLTLGSRAAKVGLDLEIGIPMDNNVDDWALLATGFGKLQVFQRLSGQALLGLGTENGEASLRTQAGLDVNIVGGLFASGAMGWKKWKWIYDQEIGSESYWMLGLGWDFH